MASILETRAETPRSRVADFDEQMWPINCAILILAGFVAGFIKVCSDFTDPRVLYNGYTHMLGVGLLIGLLFWGVWWLQGKMLRRLQLAILLSLCAHVAAAMFIHLNPLIVQVEQEVRERPGGSEEPEQRVVLNEYAEAQVEPTEEEQTFETPMLAAVPEGVLPLPPAVVPEDLTRSMPDMVIPRAPSPELLPGGPGAEPKPAELRRAGAAAQPQVVQAPTQPWTRQTPRNVELPQVAPEAPPALAPGQPSKQAEAASVAMGRQHEPGQPGALGRPAVGDPGPAGPALAAAGQLPRRIGEPSGVTNPTQPKAPERAGQDLAGTQRAAPGETPAAPSGPPGEPEKAPGQPGDTSLAKAPAKPFAGGPGTVEPGRALAGVTSDLRLPAAVARRSTGLKTQVGGEDATNSRPGTMARTQTGGINMPSTTLAAAGETQSPAAAGGATTSRVEATSNVAVQRAANSAAPSGRITAAAGSQEFGIGTAGLRVARTGMPRGAGEDQKWDRNPTMSPTSDAPRPARTPSGTSIGGVAATEVEARPQVLAEPGVGDGIAPSALASAGSGMGRARSPLPGARRNAGIGPAEGGQPGSGVGVAPGPVGISEPGRVPRRAAIASAAISGGTGEGGGLRPRRATFNGLSDAAVDGGALAMGPGGTGGGADSGAGTGAVPGVPLPGDAKGLQPRIAGPTGSIQRPVRMGALEAASLHGAPLPNVAGQRAAASQPQNPGTGQSPSDAATLPRTAIAGGANLPAAALPMDRIAEAGGGGVMSLPGGAASSLPGGPAATIHRGVGAGVPTGRATVPVGAAEAGSGSGMVAILPGPISGRGTGVPTLASVEGSTSPGGSAFVRRSSLPGTGVPGGVAEGGEPSSGTAPSGRPAGALGGSVEPGPSATIAIARGSAGLPAASGSGAGGLVGSAIGNVAGPGGAPVGPRRLTQGSDQGVPQGVATGGVGRAASNVGFPSGVAEPTVQQPAALAAGGLNPGAGATIGRGTGGPNPNGSGGAGPEGPGSGDGRGTGPGGSPRGSPVQVATYVGAGGIGESGVVGAVGIPARRGGLAGENVQMVSDSSRGRMAVARSGGLLPIGPVSEPAPAYQHRGTGRHRGFGPGEGEGGNTDKTVEIGLDFFSRVQFPDGHWSIDRLPDGVKIDDPALGSMQSDTAATGLVLLTYLGAGYTHIDDKHRAMVRRGVDWLVKHQKPDGDLFTGGSKYTHLYSHGIAAMALCEAYGMTQDAELQAPAQKAIDFIVRSQDPRGGGWRYEPGRESDTSVTGWQLMALKSGQMAGLTVPVETLRKINGWLTTAQNPGGDGRYVYNPNDDPRDPKRAESRQPSLAMTAEAMLMRMYLGQRRDNAAIVQGAEHLKAHLPEVGTAERPDRDCYYWYYATQAMYQMQGDYWTAWSNRLRTLLDASQVQKGPLAGTWHPNQPVRDRWGHAGGRLYVTAMHLLMLEVQYRYLPLFQELSK